MVTFLKKKQKKEKKIFFDEIPVFRAIDDLQRAHWDETEFR